MTSLDRLKQVIEAYGGEPARWPEAERAGLATLAAATPDLADTLHEARALDAVLGKAPGVDERRLTDLRQRILAGAGLDEAAAAGGAPVAPIAVRPLRPAPRRVPMWTAAAALAASLVFGVAFGASDFGRPAVEELAGIAGIEASDNGTLDVLDDSDVELL